jgi:hypothetical protein
LLEHNHLEVGSLLQQEMCSPEAGVSTADDDNIGFEILVESPDNRVIRVRCDGFPKPPAALASQFRKD